MAKSKINKRFDQYILRGKLRQEGFERWRYVFTAMSKLNGRERKFFIELYIVNPAISPKVAVISQKSRLAISEADLQYALAGTESASHANDEIDVKPSYVLVKAGIYGEDGKQMNKFYASSQFSYVKNTENFKVGDCLFSSKGLSGSILVTAQDLRVKPELLCNVGSMDWDLKFERAIENSPLYDRKNYLWIPIGLKTLFSGSIHVDNQEFVVLPKSSNGYIDKSWGERLNSPYFHISSSNLTSIISGRQMMNSCFALEGEFNGKLCSVVDLEGEKYCVENRKIFKKDVIIHDCSQLSDNLEGERVHWSVSIHKGKYVVDIDIYCRGKEMFVRDYEMPQGKRCLLKVLGGTGKGEIRVYKKVRKNLELLEHANINDAICEFGQTEEVGK
ncbi:hypothetical protein DYE50_03525 [Treponema ruminis]|uniref:Uncharacterized protein n=1 Tax=Treponema ruminis TaxID=744515 RepID=A0A7W8LLI5_9SPIR|nr:hypothetical protein [Treponema ruminis]MBB5225481.1 hypothetical protein [Treponema ruminis]QSI01649.1 hypothetical protein DYE50_03525 [Treponema ruminis]